MPKTGESFSGGHTVAIVDQVSELRQTVPTDYVFNLCWCEGGVSSHTLAEEMERFCRDYPEGTHCEPTARAWTRVCDSRGCSQPPCPADLEGLCSDKVMHCSLSCWERLPEAF